MPNSRRPDGGAFVPKCVGDAILKACKGRCRSLERFRALNFNLSGFVSKTETANLGNNSSAGSDSRDRAAARAATPKQQQLQTTITPAMVRVQSELER